MTDSEVHVSVSGHWNGDAIWEALDFNPYDALDGYNPWSALNPETKNVNEGDDE